MIAKFLSCPLPDLIAYGLLYKYMFLSVPIQFYNYIGGDSRKLHLRALSFNQGLMYRCPVGNT